MAKAIKILTKSARETKKIGRFLANKIKLDRSRTSINRRAFVISLEGALGAGKTTFTQGFVKVLGVKENPRSPTFVIMQVYAVENKKSRFSNFIHIDAYRIESVDLKSLGWKELISNRENIILVEWGNRVKKILPKNSLRIEFEHGERANERFVTIKQ